MISLNPNARHPCRHYLDAFREKAFPAEFYTHVHPFIASISDKSALLPRPSLPQRLSSASASATGTTTASTAAEHATSRPSLGPIEADDRIDKVWHEWETISSYLRVPGSPNTDASTSVHDASGDREMKLVHGEVSLTGLQHKCRHVLTLVVAARASSAARSWREVRDYLATALTLRRSRTDPPCPHLRQHT